MAKDTPIKNYLLAIMVALLSFLPVMMIYRWICHIIYARYGCMCLMQWDMPCDCFSPCGHWPLYGAVFTSVCVLLVALKYRGSKSIKTALYIILSVYVLIGVLVSL